MNQSTSEVEIYETASTDSHDTKENIEKISIQGDQRVWVKPLDALFTEQIKQEASDECEYQTIVDVKDEIEEEDEEGKKEEEEEKEMTIELCEPIELPTKKLTKVAIPKLRSNTDKKVKKPRGRLGRRPRPILPMTRSMTTITSANTTHLEQTQHQLIMPSPQIPGIAYQIILGDHKTANVNNPVQYTMIQPQPVFLQQTPTSTSTSSVVISQPPQGVVINQPYQMTQAQHSVTSKVTKIAPKMTGQSLCKFCCTWRKNINEHLKECLANPDCKNYKFRKIAPSTL